MRDLNDHDPSRLQKAALNVERAPSKDGLARLCKLCQSKYAAISAAGLVEINHPTMLDMRVILEPERVPA